MLVPREAVASYYLAWMTKGWLWILSPLTRNTQKLVGLPDSSPYRDVSDHSVYEGEPSRKKDFISKCYMCAFRVWILLMDYPGCFHCNI